MVEHVGGSGSSRTGTRNPPGLAILFTCVLFGCAAGASAADIAGGERLLRTGRYDECARLAAGEIARGAWSEPWHVLKIKAEVARGKYEAALGSLQDASRRFPSSVPLLLLAREVYRFNGRDVDAAAAMETIEAQVAAFPQQFATAEGRVAIGRFFLLKGADARKVLDRFYDVVTKQRPDFVEAHLASAELALDKQDFALAAETLRKAPAGAAEDPRFHDLLARAYATDDRARSARALADALKINPRHVDSLLLRADELIDAERYQEAGDVLKRALDVNPHEPRAWAYRAVLAHLRADRGGEDSARRSGLAKWAANPEVDHLIGRKLSQKYRFLEGSACQVRSLAIDPEFLPARLQLCQDLLRLGEEVEGWKLADEVFARDGYNVVAYNLITLRDRLAGFRTLQGDGFVVRMEPREADLYGQRVLALLRRAKETLCKTYGLTLKDPVIVEVFPQRKEFAVRTFGLPGVGGVLGVCFGRVVTAISPAAQGEHPANWESVLWHEFCHVVTLTKTHNAMPRWLSEGISVYEEGRQDPAWGAPLSPKFRAMILGDDLTPLSRLSSAFLSPETPLHLQFAYFESAMAVDFLVKRSGAPALNGLLDDLGAGVPINEALPRRTKTSLEQLDREFARYARTRAEAVAPGATWEEVDLPADADSSALALWIAKHPRSFPGWQRLGVRLVAEGKWKPAREALETFRGLFPEYVGAENAYVLLASVHRRLSDPSAERAALEALAARNGDAVPAYLRLMELDEASSDWRGLARDARRMLAVNPLVPAPHRQLARASEHLGERGEAIAEYRALSLLDDNDPAEVHYRLAKLLRADGKPAEARREVLRSLEEAPRFRDAHRLLLELVGRDESPPAPRPPARAVEGPR